MSRYLLHDPFLNPHVITVYDDDARARQTQRYLNATDEELRKGLEISWKGRMRKAVSGGRNA